VPWGEPAVLTVPRRMQSAEIDRVLADHRDWVERQRARQVPRLGLDPALSEDEARLLAHERLAKVAEREAERLGVTFERLAVRDQRTRWGSCSSRGTLSFNWRLALVPVEVLEYVVVHELCHVRVPNHSHRFWALVEEMRPGYRDERRWLREHGAELLAFRPAA
jgi:predicted metal-dependent hydrolase